MSDFKVRVLMDDRISAFDCGEARQANYGRGEGTDRGEDGEVNRTRGQNHTHTTP